MTSSLFYFIGFLFLDFFEEFRENIQKQQGKSDADAIGDPVGKVRCAAS